jgi:hypothetical protein
LAAAKTVLTLSSLVRMAPLPARKRIVANASSTGKKRMSVGKSATPADGTSAACLP